MTLKTLLLGIGLLLAQGALGQDGHEKPTDSPTDWLSITVALAVGALLGVAGTRFLKAAKKSPSSDELPPQPNPMATETRGQGNRPRTMNYEFENQRLNAEINRLNQDVKTLREDNRRLHAENERLRQHVKTPPLAPESSVPPSPVPPPAATVVGPNGVSAATVGSERYFSIPDVDGRQRGFWLDDNGLEAYRAHASAYRLTPVADGQTAKFEVVNAAEAMSKLVGSRVSGVLPVCTELNAYRPDAKRIITKQPGKARREGDRWVVTEPAHIEYA